MYDPDYGQWYCPDINCVFMFGAHEIKLGAPDAEISKEYCYHDWKKYTGFNETYEYCTKCDGKRK